MWVARDKDGTLLLHENRPIRNEESFWEAYGDYIILNEIEFASLKWKDEPIEVELKEVQK